MHPRYQHTSEWAKGLVNLLLSWQQGEQKSLHQGEFTVILPIKNSLLQRNRHFLQKTACVCVCYHQPHSSCRVTPTSMQTFSRSQQQLGVITSLKQKSGESWNLFNLWGECWKTLWKEKKGTGNICSLSIIFIWGACCAAEEGTAAYPMTGDLWCFTSKDLRSERALEVPQSCPKYSPRSKWHRTPSLTWLSWYLYPGI